MPIEVEIIRKAVIGRIMPWHTQTHGSAGGSYLHGLGLILNGRNDGDAELRGALAWIMDQAPATRIEFERNESYHNPSEPPYAIVAYFASDTDATAFKTRWG